MIAESAYVHPMAWVHASAKIGARSKVWQFASILRGAVIGEDCNVASGACLDGSVCGDRTILGHNLAAGPGFRIGSDCFIGPNVSLCNDAWPRVAKGGWSAAEFDGSKWAIIIEDGASIGAGAVILPGVRIGARSMVAAGAVVSRDVPVSHLWRSADDISMITRERQRMRFAREQGVSR